MLQIFTFLLGGVLIAHAQSIPQVIVEDAPVSTTTVVMLIDQVSRESNMPDDMADRFKRVAYCESKFNSQAVGDHNTSFGVFQLHLPAHPEITKEMALDPRYNIRWAANQFIKGNESIWTCSRIIADRTM